jgi:hypothetical protein
MADPRPGRTDPDAREGSALGDERGQDRVHRDHDHDHDRERDHDRDRSHRDEHATEGRRVVSRDAHDGDVRAHERFGGFSWGSDLFGWLAAAGITAILAGVLSGAGAAIGLTELEESAGSPSDETITIVGAVALLVVLAAAYYAGGYVAGRMARFDGARQGVGVWLWGIIVAVVVAVAATILGSEYNVLDNLNLPRIPIDEGDLATGGIIALVAMLAVTLLAAIAGGKAGERFHRKVDDVSAGRR